MPSEKDVKSEINTSDDNIRATQLQNGSMNDGFHH